MVINKHHAFASEQVEGKVQGKWIEYRIDELSKRIQELKSMIVECETELKELPEQCDHSMMRIQKYNGGYDEREVCRWCETPVNPDKYNRMNKLDHKRY